MAENSNATQQTSNETQGATREYKQLFGAVRRGERSYWTRIGAAFINRDGSMNLRFDFFPTDPNTTVQLREPRASNDPA